MPTSDPFKNAYLLGIAERLKVDPHRVECNFRINPKGGFLLDIRLDGRELSGPDERIVFEYLHEAFHDVRPVVVG